MASRGKLAGVDKLHVSREDISDRTDLEKSIKEKGILRPLIVDPNALVIDGVRRLAVAKSLGFKDVPILVSNDYDQTMAEIALNRSHDECYLKPDFYRILRVFLDTYPQMIERGLKLRLRRAGVNPKVKLPRAPKARDLLMTAIGVGANDVQAATTVFRWAGDKTHPLHAIALEVKGKMDTGMSGAMALKTFHRLVHQVNSDDLRSLDDQREVLTNVATSVEVIKKHLDRIGTLHPKLSTEDLEHWTRDLAQGKGALMRILLVLRAELKSRRLKEHE